MKIANIKKYLKNPRILIAEISGAGLLNWVPDKWFLFWMYRVNMGKKLRFKNPRAFTEKIQWLKLYDKNPLNTQISDKYAMREYIADQIGSGYTVPLLGIWNTFDEIDFDELPDQFVLKCTHDCGGNYICRDKNKMDINAVKDKIERHLGRNYYRYYREWAYLDIRPRIIAEEYLVDESGYELKDYKFLCFNGCPKYVAVCSDRESGHTKVDVFDMRWKSLSNEIIYRDYPLGTCSLERPKSYDKMIEMCKILSKPFPFVRVDLYSVHDEIFVGELTLYPGAGYAGYKTVKIDETVGSWLELPVQKRGTMK